MHTICSICQEEIAEPAKPLSCSHFFCMGCLEDWSKRQGTCPNCRGKFTTIEYEYNEKEHQYVGRKDIKTDQFFKPTSNTDTMTRTPYRRMTPRRTLSRSERYTVPPLWHERQRRPTKASVAISTKLVTTL